MSDQLGLCGFLERVDERVREALAAAPVPESQRKLLADTARVMRKPSVHQPLNDPLAITYLIARRACCRPNQQAEHVGAFLQFYRLSANLFDDIEDGDLAETPHACAGAPVATNNALALLCLALSSLTRAIELEPRQERRLEYLGLFNEVSLIAVGGQHVDLLGTDGASTPDEVLAMQQAKASSLRLLAECGALLAGSSRPDRARYRTIGERLALVVQIRDDLRDIYGKSMSSDLANGKVTYPVACFFETATDAQSSRFHELCEGLPKTVREVRTLLHSAGVVQRSAAAIEAFRRDIHRDMANLSGAGPERRTLLTIVDALAESVYAPPPIEATAHLWQPDGEWHEVVRSEVALFVARMRAFGPPEPPALRPWHLPQWMYDAREGVIFYPDIEGLTEEILPFHARLLGTDDLDYVASVVRVQTAAVVAHEMFHLWRHASGRLTHDHWHEEWVANRLALAYVRRHDPRALDQSLELASRVVAEWSGLLDARAERLLSSCAVRDPERRRGYAMPIVTIAVLTLEMVRRLALESQALPPLVSELLGPPVPPGMGARPRARDCWQSDQRLGAA